MKIRKIHLKDHPLFGTADIDFTDKNGKTPHTVVLAGINGSGKTTLLEILFSLLSDPGNSHEEDFFEADVGSIQDIPGSDEWTDKKIVSGSELRQLRELFSKKSSGTDKGQLPKIVYMPAEISFDELEPDIRPYSHEYAFSCEIRNAVTKDIPKYLATCVDREVYRNEDLTVREAVRNACDRLNVLFSDLDADAEIIGLRKDGSRMPVFRNSAGQEFDITELSSGEKQLFIRIMALKMTEVNNSVILVDEPEISLHPSWQQKILRVYERVGKNNQIIAATHSPHVLSSVRSENVRLLITEGGKIRIMDGDETDGAYGLPADRVLVELMGLETLRDPEVERKFEALRNMVRLGNYNTDEFRSGYKELEDIVGTPDQDLVLIQMEIDRLKKETRKSC
ncbi:MAG TPA: ATP-binding cassette domain-containing protein [Desulfobacterales bacterium]|nr:MAG: ATP-binding protein [Deltaproteobacteria bacterium]HHC24891.1 ATP-binding cassette domain-containing protein [Desulfobacterales bacterium]